MSKNLVIVESPAKAKTIEKYLGKDFQVLASYGHVRDLIPKEGAVDPQHDFAMKYEVVERNQRHIQAITKALKPADTLYLATDPDREGEAISWHLLELLNEKNLLKNKTVHRVAFHEITKKAVTEAIAEPAELNYNMVHAQQARRALDYLVGFKLSPLLWKKIRRGLSAGRVQSPALRLIVERELEIEAFQSREYWSTEAAVFALEQNFKAKLTQLDGEKITQFSITNEELATQTRQILLDDANGKLTVAKLEKKQRKSNPAPPFITSTLQQEAARKLGFTTKRTMTVAQQLYEGIDIGGETAGLITYMRTDSVNLSVDAVADIRELIAETYGAANVPKEPNVYKTKSKNAQEAHEAVRPTSARHIPSQIQAFLTAEQFKLYELIWKRTIACQMIHATLNSVAIDLSCADGKHIFRATGSSVANPGFMAVYLEGKDDSKDGDDKENFLPALNEGDTVQLNDILIAQHFTEPPPRYGEASLVKALEEYGIGRPSTYASIISTLQNREYVTLESKRFHPTDVGRIVNKFLTEHFTKYVDYSFTANLEDDLDAVARGEKAWIPLMENFWKPFGELVIEKEGSVQRKDVTQEAIDELCPQCGKALSIRLGRNGRFIGCTDYPSCNYTRNLTDSAAIEPELVEGRECPECKSPLVYKSSKYGKFIGCTGYPTCRYIEPIEKPSDTGVTCPQCQKGQIFKRKSRNGKVFYSCENYPTCDYALWNAPLNEPCPKCNWAVLTLKESKKHGVQKVCPQKGCGFVENIESDDAE
ncbi:MAG: type I DNA topoisomerase [Methylococcales bacterium]|nr:type I DNA topoisomerase [Methylococcales bacterium]